MLQIISVLCSNYLLLHVPIRHRELFHLIQRIVWTNVNRFVMGVLAYPRLPVLFRGARQLITPATNVFSVSNDFCAFPYIRPLYLFRITKILVCRTARSRLLVHSSLSARTSHKGLLAAILIIIFRSKVFYSCHGKALPSGKAPGFGICTKHSDEIVVILLFQRRSTTTAVTRLIPVASKENSVLRGSLVPAATFHTTGVDLKKEEAPKAEDGAVERRPYSPFQVDFKTRSKLEYALVRADDIVNWARKVKEEGVEV